MTRAPDDKIDHDQMCVELNVAMGHLSVTPSGSHKVWGYDGRTVAMAVDCADGPRWLRLLGMPALMGRPEFWEGSRLADDCVPRSVLRPRLHQTHHWNSGGHYYRAELYDRVDHPTLGIDEPCLRSDPQLSPAWWDGIVTTVNTMPTVATNRIAVRQGYLNWAMKTYLDGPVETHVPAWATAHGDLHWGNITAGVPYILDWERWGSAPVGWDAAVLHTYALLVPAVAAQTRHRLGHVLNTPEGRFAELAVIAEVTHAVVTTSLVPDLKEPMRARAAELMAAQR